MDLKKPNQIRLNKFLAQSAGVSRRGAESLIKKGRVFLNGKKVSTLAVFVDPKKDLVRVDEKRVSSSSSGFYLMLNKPEKVLSTTRDPKGRATVMDYIPRHKERLFPVGRLDWDSEGLLLFTNDGDLAQKILHPKNEIPKTYFVKVRGQPKSKDLQRLVRGVSTPGGRRRALFAKIIPGKKTGNLWVKVLVAEGKKRQIRLMFDTLGFPVQKLKRTAIGRLKMNKLPRGQVLRLNSKDIAKVFQNPKELRSPRGDRIKTSYSKRKISKNRSSKQSP